MTSLHVSCVMTHPLAALRTQSLPLGLLCPLPGSLLLLLSASPLLTGLHPLRWAVSFVDENVLVTFVTNIVSLVLVNGSCSQVIPKELHS